MVLTETPICEFGLKAPDFSLKDCFGNKVDIQAVKGQKGMLVVFMCNHCPYVKAILPRLTTELERLQNMGIGCVAVNSNDPIQYPEDGLEAMQNLAKQFHFSFPYCLDVSQEVARHYQAVCTPDFFGYNADLTLQYRGRFDSSGKNPKAEQTRDDLYEAMLLIAQTGKGPANQIPSIGCSIKWRA